MVKMVEFNRASHKNKRRKCIDTEMLKFGNFLSGESVNLESNESECRRVIGYEKLRQFI
jgi:hypothetical protein